MLVSIRNARGDLLEAQQVWMKLPVLILLLLLLLLLLAMTRALRSCLAAAASRLNTSCGSARCMCRRQSTSCHQVQQCCDGLNATCI